MTPEFVIWEEALPLLVQRFDHPNSNLVIVVWFKDSFDVFGFSMKCLLKNKQIKKVKTIGEVESSLTGHFCQTFLG